MFRLLIVLITPLIFLGCAPSTFQEMKSSESIKKKTFIVDENYENVYRRSLTKSKECFEMGAITAAFVADGQLYPNSNEAELTVYLIGGFGKNMIHGATFKSIGNQKTEMKLYTYWSEQYIDKMKRLFTGEEINCK